jgi:16S rRNA (adenine1518-N6/adenine1519-N6)-dimethyltransferase
LSSSARRPRLGQHFLSDRTLLGRIADALDPAPGDVVLEIGPGEGTLTEELLARGARVVAIERDRRLAENLRAWGVGRGALDVIEGDALRADWHRLLPRPTPDALRPAFSVIGNIPYQITSPLIEKALTPPLPARIVFLVQREVADRLAAEPGSKAYGALTVGVQASCRVERLFRVQPGSFRPPPTVESAVVRLTPLATPLIAPADRAALRTFVVRCFSRRRKQLRNVVAHATGRPGAEVQAGLEALDLDPAARPEALAPAQFARLLHWSREL